MGVLTISFDDGYKDTFENCVSLLSKYNLTATFAVASGKIGGTLEKRDVLSKDDIKSLRKHGHEIASHTASHVNMLTLLNQRGEPAAGEEMRRSKNDLKSLIDRRIESFVFPFIDANNDLSLRRMASRYFASSRLTSENFVFNNIPVMDPFSITGTAITTETGIKDVIKLINIAAKFDIWLMLVFHLVGDKNTMSARRRRPYRFFTRVSEFKEILKKIKSSGVGVLTQNTTIQKYRKTR